MGYSKSRITLNRRIKEFPSFFDTLARGRPARLVEKPNSADTNAYKVREALHIAALHAQHYPELAQAAGRFVVEILDDRTIQARIKEGSNETAVSVLGETPTQTPQAAGAPEAPQIVVGLRTATDIISHCLRRFPTNDPFHFPDAQLDDGELAKVWRWCRTLHPPRVIIKPKGTNAITIANKPGRGHPLSHSLWRPSTEPEESDEVSKV